MRRLSLNLLAAVVLAACGSTDPGTDGSIDDGGGDARADAGDDRAGPDGTSAPPPCQSDDDCRLFSDTCDGCACRVLASDAADPVCEGSGGACFADPCDGREARCDPAGSVCVSAQRVPAKSCTTDADCRLLSDYCGGCACAVLTGSEPDPGCPGGTVACESDPCEGRSARCDLDTQECTAS